MPMTALMRLLSPSAKQRRRIQTLRIVDNAQMTRDQLRELSRMVEYSAWLSQISQERCSAILPSLRLRELDEIVENDRYPFSPRIRTLRGILAKLPVAHVKPLNILSTGQSCSFPRGSCGRVRQALLRSPVASGIGYRRPASPSRRRTAISGPRTLTY